MSEIEQSECYSPDIQRYSEQGEAGQAFNRRNQKLDKNSIEGKWSEQQNLKYVIYMDYHYKIFVSKQKRKSQRIFKSLSEYLTTRTPRQCRSHFQKLMNKFKKLKKVKQHYQEKLGHQRYKAQYELISTDLKNKSTKIEETEASKLVRQINEQTQTEPMNINLTDLSSIELMKLMNLLNQYQKIQLRPLSWMQQIVAHKMQFR